MPSKKETVTIIAISAALTAGTLGVLQPSDSSHQNNHRPATSQAPDDAGEQSSEATRINGDTAGDAQLGQKAIPAEKTPPDPDVKFWSEP